MVHCKESRAQPAERETRWENEKSSTKLTQWSQTTRNPHGGQMHFPFELGLFRFAVESDRGNTEFCRSRNIKISRDPAKNEDS